MHRDSSNCYERLVSSAGISGVKSREDLVMSSTDLTATADPFTAVPGNFLSKFLISNKNHFTEYCFLDHFCFFVKFLKRCFIKPWVQLFFSSRV